MAGTGGRAAARALRFQEISEIRPDVRASAELTFFRRADHQIEDCTAQSTKGDNMFGTLMKSLIVLTAASIASLGAASALAADIKDTGSFDAGYVKRNVAELPNQEGHVLLLTESRGTSSNPGGLVDGFATTIFETADLKQGNGRHEGYVVYSKGSDQQVVRFEGKVATTMKNGQPNTTMKGDYMLLDGNGALSGIKGKGTYTGYFTAQDKFHVDWEGHRTPSASAMAKSQ